MTDAISQVETLERELEEHKANSAFSRTYGLLAAVFLALALAPYSTHDYYTAWSVPAGSGTLASLSTFTVLAVFPLTLMLVCASIRLPKSPVFGLCLAGFALVL